MPKHQFFQGQSIDYTGEGVYAFNEHDARWYQIGTFDEVAYQMRLGRSIEWIEDEDILTIEVEV